ncbi:hypothetical protein ACSV5K_25100 [Agrobacterium pusense]|uniref:hypothetical protein n=1 Tax=Agrobacterium pusense TaxID=648995 RepID=UPI003FD370AC
MMTVAQKIYSEEWAGNASAYHKQGVYDRLTDHLLDNGSIQSVIDVGCGLGHGLRSLREKIASQSLRLLGLDENPDCLSMAAKTLGLERITANIDRMQSEILPSGFYRWRYRPGKLHSERAINLVQSNLLIRDPELQVLLKAQPPFDAVCLWFVGIHKATANTELARHFEIKSDADYRELVEDAVIEAARDALRSGGLLQVAIRGGFPSPSEARAQTASTYGSFFADQGFRLVSVEAIPYTEPQETSAIAVRSASNPEINALPMYAVSMIGKRG